MQPLRTFGIVAHVDAGKTTLTERILHTSGLVGRPGRVDDGTALTDWLPQERARGISIGAAVVRTQWSGVRLQIVDTPGHVDFGAEVARCLGVLDGVVVVIDGVRGIESRTAAVWHAAVERRLPVLVFVNKLDRPGADAAAVAAALETEFGCRTAPLVVPFTDPRQGLLGLGDALGGALQWFAEPPAPTAAAALQAELRRAHDRLVERLADAEDDVFAAAVAGRALAPAALRQHLAAAVQDRRLVPVLAGAALHGQGVDWLLDAIVALLPDAAVALARSGITAAAGDPAAPFAGQVFKVQHLGVVWNYVRVLRGRLVSGMRCGSSRPAVAEFEVSELLAAHADRHRALLVAEPGEIAVLPGEFGLRTGDAVFAAGTPVVLPGSEFPTPVLAQTFEPAHDEHAQQLLTALRELALDDPTLRVDREHGQIVVRGMGELHLDVVADQVQERCRVPFRRSRLRVAVRRTIRGTGRARAEARAMVAGIERVVACEVEVDVGDSQGAVARAEVDALACGPLGDVARAAVDETLRHDAQGPLVGARVRIAQLAMDDGPPVEALIEQAAVRALGFAMAQAGVVPLEPWVAFEITCPEAGCQAVLADLGARQAEVQSVASGQLGARLRGCAPLRRMLGYVTRLRSITRGRGQLDLRPVGERPTTASDASLDPTGPSG